MGVGGQRRRPTALPPGKSRYPFCRRLDGLLVRSGQVRKISPPPGFDPGIVQPLSESAIPTALSRPRAVSASVKYCTVGTLMESSALLPVLPVISGE